MSAFNTTKTVASKPRIVNAKEMITKAAENHTAIGAFNINNLEWMKAIINGSIKAHKPVILQVSMGAADYMGGYDTVAAMVEAYVKHLDNAGELPDWFTTVLHADHADREHSIAALNAGFTSIMFDGHALSIEDNLKTSKELISLAHSYGATIETEVGSIGGSEDGVYGTGEISPIEDVLAMNALKPDIMAVGIGNIHGVYPDNWKGLDFDYIKKVRDALDAEDYTAPLVLHGGSGIPEDQVHRAIKLGVAKVNVNTELQLAGYHALKAEFAHELVDEHTVIADKLFDPRKLYAEPTRAMMNTVIELSEQFAK